MTFLLLVVALVVIVAALRYGPALLDPLLPAGRHAAPRRRIVVGERTEPVDLAAVAGRANRAGLH